MTEANVPGARLDVELRASFSPWAARVRRRLAFGYVLTGATFGLSLGAAFAFGAWTTRHGALRPASLALGLVGAAAGAIVARRKRWEDAAVALYLDARLGSHEAIATALDRSTTRSASRDAVVVAHAKSALGRATPSEVRPPFLQKAHAILPLAAAAIALTIAMPLKRLPLAPKAPPGATLVTLSDVRALERVIALEALDARDPRERERLKKLADEARKLREKLERGVEKREALADLAKLRDGLTAERLALGDGESRQGLEAAVGKLGEHANLRDAARALGDRDLTEFDETMQELANRLEREDRDKAKTALEEAAEAARKAHAPDVARALEEQKKLFGERGEKADALRELAKEIGKGLPKSAQKELADLGQSSDPEAQRKLAKRLEEALEKLSPEERKRLAARIGRELESGATPEAPTKKKLREMAKRLDSEEAQKELEKELRRMAEESDESGESERQRRLEDAQRDADKLDGALGGSIPMPVANEGPGKSGPSGPGGKAEAGGSGPGGSKADHGGQTAVVEGPGIRSKADAHLGGGAPMPGMVLGRTAGRAGETANSRGEGAIGNAAPSELDGIERSDVPEEYREQIGRYFRPR